MSNLSDYKKASQELANTQHNQASEDELARKAILKILHQTESCTGCKDHYKKPHKCDMDLAAPRCVKRVKKLEALIRTEKLKLLAEVRERVIGKSDYQPGNPAPDLVEHNRLVRDGLRFEQLIALNKLETERD